MIVNQCLRNIIYAVEGLVQLAAQLPKVPKLFKYLEDGFRFMPFPGRLTTEARIFIFMADDSFSKIYRRTFSAYSRILSSFYPVMARSSEAEAGLLLFSFQYIMLSILTGVSKP